MPLIDHGHAMVDTSRRQQLRQEVFRYLPQAHIWTQGQDVTALPAQGWEAGPIQSVSDYLRAICGTTGKPCGRIHRTWGHRREPSFGQFDLSDF